MSENSAIEWTDTTWNPVTGCTKISAGCDNCYAERFSVRFRGVKGHPFETGFDLTLRPERLMQPLGWKRPRMIFLNSMSDLFHKKIPQRFVSAVFDTMEKADWHTYQILTKRSSLMQRFVNERYQDTPAPPHLGWGARPMKPEWALNVRDQCIGAAVPFFFKQWGGRSPKAAGRLLEGREWNEFPLSGRAIALCAEIEPSYERYRLCTGRNWAMVRDQT